MASGPPPLDWGVGRYETTAAQLEPTAQVIVDRAAIRPGERVLDLGCGTGNAALAAARIGAEVVGVDPAPRLLEVAAERAAAEDLPLEIHKGDAGAIPLPDGSMDAVVSVFAVIFAPDPVAAAGEMARVTTPTGRVVLSAWRPEGPIFEMNTAASAIVMEALGASPPPPTGIAWHEPASLEALFGPHGFDVGVEDHELAYRAESIEDFVDAQQRSHPMAVSGMAALEQLGRADEVRAQIRERMVALLTEASEDPPRLTVSSPYVVATMQRAGG